MKRHNYHCNKPNPTETQAILPLGNIYRYDQLNRILQSNSYDGYEGGPKNITGSNDWTSCASPITDMYKNEFTYDANGNILTQRRHDETGQQFDDLIYQYNYDAVLGWKILAV